MRMQILPEFPDYIIMSDGRVYSKITNRFKTLRYNLGYKITSLRNKNGKEKTIKVHRLLALAFIPNPDNKPCVDHINRKRDDNRLCNLRWVTHCENMQNMSTRKHSTPHQHISLGCCRRKNKTDDNYYRIQINRNHKRIAVKQFSTSKYTLEDVVKVRNELYKEYGIENCD